MENGDFPKPQPAILLLHLWHRKEYGKLLSSSPVPELQHGPRATRDVLELVSVPAVGSLSFTCPQGAATPLPRRKGEELLGV